MYHWSKILKKHRPEIISDIFDDKFYTFKVQDYYGKKIKRKDALAARAAHAATAALAAGAASAHAAGAASAHAAAASLAADTTLAAIYAVDVAWEGSCWNKSQVFKNIIDKNVPCILMHKVKNEWAPEIDTIVCFMTGNTLDVFLVHPDDLTEWDPDEEI